MEEGKLEDIVEEKVEERIEEEREKIRKEIKTKLRAKEREQSNVSDCSISRRSFLKKLSSGAIGLGALSLTPAASQLKLTKNGVFGEGSTSVGNFNSIKTVKQKTTGYSWSDKSGNRSLDTWYQAPSDRDIWFGPHVSATADSTTIELSISINTSESKNYLFEIQDTVNSAERICPGPYRVPAGHSYIVESGRDTGSFELKRWPELR